MVLTAALLHLAAAKAEAAIVLTNLHTFVEPERNPYTGLVLGADGTFYGTTLFGGDYDKGAVFRIAPSGSFNIIASFDGTNGAYPETLLVQGRDGNFYGTAGTVFRLTTNGALTALFSFSNTNGTGPYGLCEASDGNFYGVTRAGGAHDRGTVFKINPAGVCASLFSFDGTNGSSPFCQLVQGRDGKLYGTTGGGGASTNTTAQFGVGDGTLFSITTNGQFASLCSFFRTNGATPIGPLVQGLDGNFYGTTRDGGPDTNGNPLLIPGVTGFGTVFRLTPAGGLTTLVWFNKTNGANPLGGLTMDAAGNFYGSTAYGGTNAWPSGDPGGTLFKVTPDGTLTTLYAFGYSDPGGYLPIGALVQGFDGNFYGTTHYTHSDYGAVFRVSIPLSPVFQSPTRNGNSLALNWSAVADQTYQLQFTTNLASTNWIDLGSAVTATNDSMTASDVIGSDPARFYRVVLLP